jgi:hypothetical protein
LAPRGIAKTDRKIRKLMTIHGQHHPKADAVAVRNAYIIEIKKLMEYVDSTEDPLIQIVRTHQNNTKSAMVQTARSLRTE